MPSVTGIVDIANAFTGIGGGTFISLCAIYILFAPKISVIDREHNVFVLQNAAENKLIDLNAETIEIRLSRSPVYGSYIYRAAICGDVIDGHIVREQSLWKRMHVAWKTVCCILSEILIFVWLTGRMIFFFRSFNLPKRLEIKMKNSGFTKVEIPYCKNLKIEN